ncbi:hypothetical protein Pelo_6766 [Pelomyxa schiedti]|nr:hypothetical protein Pelo_6766 [Pelomyxa schiedti]
MQGCSSSTAKSETFMFPAFLRVKEELEKSFPGVVVIGNKTAPRTGAFEVTDERGTLYWSAFDGDSHNPKTGAVSARMRERGFSS